MKSFTHNIKIIKFQLWMTGLLVMSFKVYFWYQVLINIPLDLFHEWHLYLLLNFSVFGFGCSQNRIHLNGRFQLDYLSIMSQARLFYKLLIHNIWQKNYIHYCDRIFQHKLTNVMQVPLTSHLDNFECSWLRTKRQCEEESFYAGTSFCWTII